MDELMNERPKEPTQVREDRNELTKEAKKKHKRMKQCFDERNDKVTEDETKKKNEG